MAKSSRPSKAQKRSRPAKSSRHKSITRNSRTTVSGPAEPDASANGDIAAQKAVAAQGNITFIRPGKLGDELVATAREISRNGRSGIYDVQVTAGDIVIAEFRGHSRVIPGSWLPETDTKQK